jgi:phage-related minor tail protein
MASNGAKQVAVRLSVENAEQVRAALLRLGEDGKAALGKLNFDTSSQAGPKIFHGALDEARVAANDLTGSLGPLGNVLGGLGGAYLAAGAAAGGFAELLLKSVEAGEAEEQSQRRIQSVLNATGHASGQTADSIEEMAARISHSSLQTKEDVLNAAAVLATFRNVGPDAFEKTLVAAADMSAVFGGDLLGNVQKLGLALDDPIQGMSRLKRVGLDLSPAQKEIITNLERTGDLAGAQGALLDALSKKMGGAAAGQDQGLTGAAHSAAMAWHEFLVELNQTGHFTDIAAGGLNSLTNLLHGLNTRGGALDLFLGLPVGATSMAFDKLGPKVDHTADGHAYRLKPGDTDAMLGPGRAAQERQEALGLALDNALKELNSEASGVGARQRFINKKLDEIAKANETTSAGLAAQDPGRYRALVAAAGRDFDAEHHDENAKKAEEERKRRLELLRKDGEDQIKLDAEFAVKTAAAYQAKIASQDAFRVHILDHQAGYFDALAKQNTDWLANETVTLNAERDKELAALDAKKSQYDKDKVAFAEYQQRKADIATIFADKQARLDAESATKSSDLARLRQGNLFPEIEKGSQDLNLSLKNVAADGLNSLETGFIDVIKGTENVGNAFSNMTAKILEEIAKIVFEKQVVAPLADMLNGLIDGSGSGGGGGSGGASGFFASLLKSANGNVFSGGNVVPFANGGVVNSATVVPMALMGEAGPEAILPLARGSNGKLGLSAPPGAGDLHNHFSPSIVIQGGAGPDEIAALREELNSQRRDFFSNSVQAYAQMKARRIA